MWRGGMMDRASFAIIPDDPSLGLRPARPIDEQFIRHLFEQVSTGQFTGTGLSGPILGQVIAQQFRSQAAGYAMQFPEAISLIVTRNGTSIGRLLLHCASERWHVIDVALLPAECGRGAGTAIFDALEAIARQRGAGALTLSVLTNNLAARRFYARQGFIETGPVGAAHFAMKKDLV
jgi:ribosomal protein S18 acetylase RimI-like enzyme